MIRLLIAIIITIRLSVIRCETTENDVIDFNRRLNLMRLQRWGVASQLETDDQNLEKTHPRDKRFIRINKDQANVEYQKCKSYAGKDGHCKYIQYCSIKEFDNNILKYIEYLCVIDGKDVGVCCPDVQNELNDVAVGSSIIQNLPTTVDEEVQDAGVSFRTVVLKRGCGVATKSLVQERGRPQSKSQEEWPWIASLLKWDTPLCAGVLITDQHILTAAHCLDKTEPSDWTVRLGEYDFETDNETRKIDFNVTDIRMHEQYEPSNYDNDIAIMKVDRSTAFNSYIWPICLPPIDLQIKEPIGYVAGWGTEFYSGPISDVLLQVEMPVWDIDECRRALLQPISDNVLCAAGRDGGKDTCQGDSGGPLMVKLGNRWINIGIVSWGVKCGNPGKPGVYTRVNRYLDWIKDNTLF